MSNYIQISNNQNITIINDTYKNVSLTRTRVNIPIVVQHDNEDFPSNAISYRDGKYADPTSGIGSFTISGRPFCVFSCTNPNFSFFARHVKDLFFLEIGGVDGHKITELANAVSVYEFDFQQYSGNSKLGLQIFSASGEEIFNSNLKYLRILDTIYYPPGMSAGSVVKTYNHKIGALVGTSRIANIESDEPDYQCIYFPSQNSIKIDGVSGDASEGSTNILIVNLDGIE